MSLVEKIRELVQNQHMSLAEVERRLDLSQGSIRKWDESSPSIDKVEKVAAFFNVSTDYLVGRESYEDMKLKQAQDDFMTSYRVQKNELSLDDQESFENEMQSYMEYIRQKYSKK